MPAAIGQIEKGRGRGKLKLGVSECKCKDMSTAVVTSGNRDPRGRSAACAVGGLRSTWEASHAAPGLSEDNQPGVSSEDLGAGGTLP